MTSNKWEQLRNPHDIPIKSLATCQGSLCPCTITQGTTKTLAISASSGISPYTYNWSIIKPDGTVDTTPTQPSFLYMFSQQGNYIISAYVMDSCPKISNVDSCIITVISGGPSCSPPCTSTQSCILGTCVENDYIKYGTIGVGAIVLMLLLK